MIATLRKITGNNIDVLKRPLTCAFIEGLCIAAPYAILAIILPSLLRNSLAPSHFWWMYGVIILMFALRTACSFVSYGGGMVAGYRMGASIRLHVGEHLRTLPMGFFANHDIGELVNRLFFNVGMVEMMVSHFMTQAMAYVATPLGIAFVMLWLSPQMSGVVFIFLLVALLLLWGLLKLVDREGKRRIAMIDNTNAHILEYLHGITVLKAFNITGTGFKRLDKALRALQKFSIRFELKGFSVVLAYAAILEMAFVALIFVGMFLVRQGKIGVPEMITFLIISIRFSRPLHRFAENSALTRASFSGARAIEDILDTPSIAGIQLPSLQDFSVHFKDVTFRYEREDVIKKVTFTAPAQSMTAFVGPSGSGKSTLARLIARFWDIHHGSITIGGQNIAHMSPDALLEHMAMVFQDVYLFKDSIFNNIAFGKEGATKEEVIKAARLAQCHDFIMQLPGGYETVVGESGGTLSGGEKQRIAIARAILKNAPIILLDEATASLDPENDQLIQKAIDTLIRSKTLIVIAHRLHTIKMADNIVVLEKGKVVEQGQHEQLLRKKGLYARMWQEQQKPVGFQHNE